MFHGLFKSKFYSKCKSNINLLKKRLEPIRNKKSVMQKHWKNDIAELLRNGHDIDAYGRVERLLVEQNMLACYEFIEKFCGCISNHLSAMNKQRDCPEECKEAVPSLMYAAARFYDLPELRDLRTMFTERYRNSLSLIQIKRSNSPTKKIKIQLLQDIAQESNIGWNSKGLEQKLYTTAPKQDHPKCGSLSNMDNAVPETDNQNTGNRLSNGKGFITKRKDVIANRYRKPSSSEEERTTDSSQDGLKTSSKDEVEKERPLHHKFIPPPYLKKKADKNKSSSEEPPPTKLKGNVDKPKPRSVGRRNLKPQEDAKEGLRTKHAVDCHPRDEEERKLDGHLMQYSKKQSPFESSKTKAYLKPPPSQQRDH
ncbi:hypothetical protein SLA2020_348400 [Shorea laevis]